jgi:predicted GNAT family N-acyltransferase
MVDQKHHGQGIGSILFHERWELIKRDFTGVPLTLGTSQFTSAFYAKMGFEITSVVPDGYGKGIDQVNMTFHP